MDLLSFPLCFLWSPLLPYILLLCLRMLLGVAWCLPAGASVLGPLLCPSTSSFSDRRYTVSESVEETPRSQIADSKTVNLVTPNFMVEVLS